MQNTQLLLSWPARLLCQSDQGTCKLFQAHIWYRIVLATHCWCLMGPCLRISPSCLRAHTSHTQYVSPVWQSCSSWPQASRTLAHSCVETMLTRRAGFLSDNLMGKLAAAFARGKVCFRKHGQKEQTGVLPLHIR